MGRRGSSGQKEAVNPAVATEKRFDCIGPVRPIDAIDQNERKTP
jgi:hypothetical protein